MRCFRLHAAQTRLTLSESLRILIPAPCTDECCLCYSGQHVLFRTKPSRIEKCEVEFGALRISLVHLLLGCAAVERCGELRSGDDAADDGGRLCFRVEVREVREVHLLQRSRERVWKRDGFHARGQCRSPPKHATHWHRAARRVISSWYVDELAR